MATNIMEPVTIERTSRPTVTSLQEVAETILADALQFAHDKFTQPMRAAGLEELMQRHDFIDYFKLGLAERIANTLAAHDEHVQAIYYFDPSLGSDAGTETYTALDPSINLLIRVKLKSAALSSFIAALDDALAREVRKLPSPYYGSLVTILNAILITEEDVEQGRGYAALLSSLYLKPRQVW